MAENCEDVQRFHQQQNGHPMQNEFQQQFVFPAEQLPSFPAKMMQLISSLQQIVQQIQVQNVELLRMYSLVGVHVPSDAETYTAGSTHNGDLSFEDRANIMQVESQRLLGLQCANEQIKLCFPQTQAVQAIIPLGQECSGKGSLPMKRGKEEQHVNESMVVKQRMMLVNELDRISPRSQDAEFNDTVVIDQPWWQIRFPGSRSTLAATGRSSSPDDETISDCRYITDRSSQHFSRDCKKKGRLQFDFFTTIMKGIIRKKFITNRPRLRPRTRWKHEDSSKCEPSQIWCHAAIVVTSSEL